jgi:hypothetical protein
MKKIPFIIPVLIAAALPLAASAHEVDTYKIGNSYYQIVIGSLNEPVAVDDKTGVDLRVTKCYTAACAPTRGDDGDMDGPAGTPVTGLEDSLKVTLKAAGKEKTLDISPQYGKDGAYSAAYYPTVATTMSYQLKGEISGTPVDLTFTCMAEHSMATTDTTQKELSDGVTQTSHSGAFGCPGDKGSLGFPEVSASVRELASKRDTASMALAAAALALAAIALVRTRRS